MFRVLDLPTEDPATAAAPPKPSSLRCCSSDDSGRTSTSSSLEHPDMLRLVYAKARSMTGVSLCSTDSSSISSSGRHDVDDDDDERLDAISSSPVLLSADQQQIAISDDDDEMFFDCRSHMSTVSHPDDEIAQYVNGMCVYADGRPAFVHPGYCISEVPDDFLELTNGNIPKARRMWEFTQKWREENDIWRILTRPNKRFHHSKRYYPSCFHGVDKVGAVVEFSWPGQMVPKKLLPNSAVFDEMLEHHCFMQEYNMNCLYTHTETWDKVGLETEYGIGSNPGVAMIVDVKDTGLKLLSGDVFIFLKRMIQTSTAHYPCMASRVIILNSPFWIAGVFATLKPLLPDCLPVDIVSKGHNLSTLQQYINMDQIPPEYGGSSPYPLHQHPFELRLYEAVEEAANYESRQKQQSASKVLRWKDSLDSDVFESDRTRESIASSLDEVPESGQASSLCAKVIPFVGFGSRKPTFILDTEDDSDPLTLAPHRPAFDFVAVTRNFWTSILRGFDGCGGRNAHR